MSSVIVIGAGMAGLSAVQTLNSHGIPTTILEARNRIGGRTWTDYSLGFPFDLGAFAIHGLENNPIADLANQFHLKIKPISLYSAYFANAKSISSNELKKSEHQFEELLQTSAEYAKKAKNDLPLLDAMEANYNPKNYPDLNPSFYSWWSLFLSLWSGAGVKQLSARHTSEDEVELGGGHHLIEEGYNALVFNFVKTFANFPVILNCEVLEIDYNSKKVKIKTNHGDYEANAVIITVPLGVLKKGSITFNPPLPEEKRQSINKLDMGVLDKIALEFPKVFWPEEDEIISHFSKNYSSISWFINYYQYFRKPILLAMLSAQTAKRFEELDERACIDEVMRVLKDYFGNAIPDPVNILRTSWNKDPYTFGSYSYIPVGASGEDYDVIAEPVNNKLFFAGEATNRQFPGTTHGAYLSGQREAERIIRSGLLKEKL